MKLTQGQINCLYAAMPYFMCQNCGAEQKIACDKVDECLLIQWVDEMIKGV